MQLILSYADYVERLENSFLYEEIINSQRVLNSLFNRDKSNLISYQRMNKQLADIIEKDSLMLSINEQKELKIQLLEIIQQWDSYLDHIHSINNLILLANQYNHHIEHQTLKIIHYAYQSMSISEVKTFQADLFNLIEQDLRNMGIDFSSCVLPEQRAMLQKQAEEQIRLNQERLQQERLQQERLQQEEIQRLANLVAEQQRLENKRKEDEARLAREQQLRENQQVNPLKREELNVDLDIQKMFCPSCQKIYPQHYLVCLCCGNKLIQQII